MDNNITNAINEEIVEKRKLGTKGEKARYWNAVVYPENMIPTWQEEIGDILQQPLAYCIHNKDHLAQYIAKRKNDIERQRKIHVHIILAYPNTTTYNAVLTAVNKLSLPGKRCCNTVEPSFNIRHSYEYLIHNTKTAQNQKKYQYDESERILVNGFDIGCYEQLGTKEINEMIQELCDDIIKNQIPNFADLYCYVRSNYDMRYFEILKTHSALLERITKGVYQHNLNIKF